MTHYIRVNLEKPHKFQRCISEWLPFGKNDGEPRGIQSYASRQKNVKRNSFMKNYQQFSRDYIT